MRLRSIVGALFCSLLLAMPFAAHAEANRALLDEEVLQTNVEASLPPPEGEIEGACGLAISPAGEIYVSDYYHRRVDVFSTAGVYRESLPLPGQNPVIGVNTLDGVCGLAFDSAGNLFANEFHQALLRLRPSEATIGSADTTGIAIDRGTDDLWVNRRTYIARYETPVDPGDEPAETIDLGAGADAYGIAAFAGRVYVPDASDQTVEVYEPAVDPVAPVQTIAGFNSLVDAAATVDPSNGHLLVIDNLQPLFEHPQAAVKEFDSDGTFLGRLPGAPVDGEPSGLAVDADGELYVTDGNDEGANVFAYGPYTSAPLMAVPPPPPEPQQEQSIASAASVSPMAQSTPEAPTRAHRHRNRRPRGSARKHRRHLERGVRR
jgi:hypothetical protein